MSRIKYIALILGLAGFLFAGCTPKDKDSKTKEKTGKSTTEANKGGGNSVGPTPGGTADHGHDHAHVHGPKDGELVFLTDAKLVIECVSKYSQDLIIFYIYEEDHKTAKKIECENLVVSYKEGEVKTVEIPAVNVEDGKADVFEIEDESVALARKTQGLLIEFEIGGKKFSAKLPKDPH